METYRSRNLDSSSSSGELDDSSDDEDILLTRAFDDSDVSFGVANPTGVSGSSCHGKRKNCEWSTVLTENTVTENVHAVVMNNNKSLGFQDRESENYDYALKNSILENDTSQHDILETEVDYEDELDLFRCESPIADADDKFKNICSSLGKRKDSYEYKDYQNSKVSKLDEQKMYKNKHKVSIKARLGKVNKKTHHLKSVDKNREISAVICKKLNEPKRDLIERVVKYIGVEKSLELLHMTEDVQEMGGMFTKDQKRKRTSGGVYFSLLKSIKDITKSQINNIYAVEKKLFQARKKKIARRKNYKILSDTSASMHSSFKTSVLEELSAERSEANIHIESVISDGEKCANICNSKISPHCDENLSDISSATKKVEIEPGEIVD